METTDHDDERTIEPFAPTFTPNPPQTMDPSLPPTENSSVRAAALEASRRKSNREKKKEQS